MAQLKNLDRIFDLANGNNLTVGNNRVISRVNRAQFVGLLYDNPVFSITLDSSGESGNCRITLNTCGFMTVTTRAAMVDFCQAFGVTVGVSFAKGVFIMRYGKSEITSNGYGVLSFHAERFGKELE